MCSVLSAVNLPSSSVSLTGTKSHLKMRMTLAASTLTPFNAAAAMGGGSRESEHTPRLVSFGGDMPMVQQVSR